MTRYRLMHPAANALLAAVALAALAARAGMRTPAVSAAGAQLTIEGTVASVDTAPWAYDGNAVVQVSGTAHGTVAVQLPARWNLCRARPVEEVQGLQKDMRVRVRVTGTVDAPDRMTVCEHASHGLQRID